MMTPARALKLLALALALGTFAGCSGSKSTPVTAATLQGDADRQRNLLQNAPISLSSNLDPAFIPMHFYRSNAAEVRDTLGSTATLAACRSALESKRAKVAGGQATAAHGYCIEARKDGTRTVHTLF